jgi:hypothetical protein
MQRSWVMAILVVSGLGAQTPPPAPLPAPVQAPLPGGPPPEGKPTAPLPPKAGGPGAAEAKAPGAFEQLRPSQRKLAYTLNRAALSVHELGYYQGHPKTVEVRDALEALVRARLDIPEKAQTALPAAEAYLSGLWANHGLYNPDGTKLLLGGTWKELQTAARAAAKTGPKDLEPRLLKLKGLLFDPKVDAAAPGWAEPEPPAKGRKAKAGGPKAPEGFAAQKATAALWVKRARAWIDDVPQQVEVKGETKTRRLPDPVQAKALDGLLAWLAKDDLDLLRDPGLGWLDLRRLGDRPGAGLLARAVDIAGSKAPEGPAGGLALLPGYEAVLGESRFGKGEEKRRVLVEVKQVAPAATLADQMTAFERLGRSPELEVK